jgi:cytoskeletal protein RodZ
MATSFKRTELGIYTTVSEQLKRAREEKNLTLTACASRLAIQEKYLAALETSQYHLLPGEMYTKAWIKKYANFLGVNTRDLMISYDKENSIRAKLEQKNGIQQKRLLPRFAHLITGRRLSIGFVILLVLAYAGFVIHESISPPVVTFATPLKDFRTQDNSTILKGQTEPGTTVTINKQPVVLDSSNAFTQEIALTEGLNSITIEAKKKHSRSFIKELSIVKTALPAITSTTTATTTGPNN